MSEFEFVVGLHTIVLGLATAKILTTLSDTLKYRETITTFWVHSLWCIIVLLTIIGYWYALWRIQAEATAFGYAEFLGFFSVSIALYLMSSFLSLDLGEDRSFDLEAHFYRVRVPVFLSLTYVFAFFSILGFVGDPVYVEAGTTNVAWLDLVNAILPPALVILGLAFKAKRAQQIVVVLYAICTVLVEINQAAVGGT